MNYRTKSEKKSKLPDVYSSTGFYSDHIDEKWIFRTPFRADHIRVNRGFYFHHGIYISLNEVVHFTGQNEDGILGDSNTVIRTDLGAFLRGGRCEVRAFNSHERSYLRPQHEIVNFARSMLGSGGYDLFDNNCEHFCNLCLFKKPESKQINNLKKGGFMGIFSLLFGSKKTETITTIYEPDKVRVAEIENQAKLMLKKLEHEGITIKKEAQLEVAKALADIEIDIFTAKMNGIKYLETEMQVFAENMGRAIIERHREIDSNLLEQQVPINKYYDDTMEQIYKKREVFIEVTLPKLYTQLKAYSQETIVASLYQSLIEDFQKLFLTEISERVKLVNEQRQYLLKDAINSKNLLKEHLLEFNRFTTELAGKSRELLLNGSNNQSNTINSIRVGLQGLSNSMEGKMLDEGKSEQSDTDVQNPEYR
ncbi:MAG: lecithin retinol acyltransferase family protein [Ignavibacteriaceae bacterium]|nr:lecithin retinol acyltransferase family protein [Ignavibacteriaceae bacterium]